MHILLFLIIYFFFRVYVEYKGWKFIIIVILVLFSLPLAESLCKVLYPNIIVLTKGVTPCECIDNYNLGSYYTLSGKDIEVRKKCNAAYDGFNGKVEDSKVCFWHKLDDNQLSADICVF